MSSFDSIYAAALAIAAMTSIIIAIFTLSRRGIPGGTAFSLLMLATATWAWTGFMEFMTPNFGSKIIWSKFSYLGVANLAPLWFVFSLYYTRRDRLVTPRRLIILWIIPAIIISAAATNEYHGLVWRATVPMAENFHIVIKYTYGPLVWVNMTYSYILLFIGTVILLRFTLRSPLQFKNQTIVLVCAALIPWVGNIIYVTGFSPKPWLDLTPFFLSATGLLISWSMFRYQLLNLIPVAHDALFANMQTGVLVIDSSNRILDVNPAARKFLGLKESSVGSQLGEVAPLFFENFFSPPFPVKTHEFNVSINNILYRLSVSITALLARQRIEAGKLILMQDITEMKRSEEALRESEERWNFALEGSGNGVWDWDVETDRVFYSNQWKELLGFPHNVIGDSISEWRSRIHPDDVHRVRDDLRKHFEHITQYFNNEHRLLCADGQYRWFYYRGKVTEWSSEGAPLRMIGTHTDISLRKNQESEREELISSLKKALSEINTLQGLIPICSHCKKIRNDDGYWQQLEHYFYEHSGTEFTHGICPECMQKYYANYINKEKKPS